jgi:hypothetical protein
VELLEKHNKDLDQHVSRLESWFANFKEGDGASHELQLPTRPVMAPIVSSGSNADAMGEDLPTEYHSPSDEDDGIEQLVAPMNRLLVSSPIKFYWERLFTSSHRFRTATSVSTARSPHSIMTASRSVHHHFRMSTRTTNPDMFSWCMAQMQLTLTLILTGTVIFPLKCHYHNKNMTSALSLTLPIFSQLNPHILVI